MATIFEMLSKWQQVNVETEIPAIIQRNKEVAAELNRKQLKSGKTSKGDPVQPSYNSTIYALDKNRSNSLPGLGTPDLYLTGAFHRGFYAQVKAGKSIIFGSTDMKSSDLEANYTKEIFGLTRDNKQLFLSDTIMPELRLYITRITGLKFI